MTFNELYRLNYKKFENRILEYEESENTFEFTTLIGENNMFMTFPAIKHILIKNIHVSKPINKITMKCGQNIICKIEVNHELYFDFTTITPNGILRPDAGIYFILETHNNEDLAFTNTTITYSPISIVRNQSLAYYTHPIYSLYHLNQIGYTVYGNTDSNDNENSECFNFCYNIISPAILEQITYTDANIISLTILDKDYHQICWTNESPLIMGMNSLRIMGKIPSSINIKCSFDLQPQLQLFFREYIKYTSQGDIAKIIPVDLESCALEENIKNVVSLKNNECPIRKIMFKVGDKVSICKKCENAFLFDSVCEWFDHNFGICPVCKNYSEKWDLQIINDQTILC
jgi:hypothetical protein